jgi:hypothetical protein
MKKTTMFKIAGTAAGVALPVAMVFAQGNTGNPFISTPPTVAGNFATYNGSFIQRAFDFVRSVLFALPPILVAIAGVIFMVSIIQFIWKGKEGDAAAQTTARNHVMYSLLALVILLGFWGMVGIISNIIGVTPGSSVTGGAIPKVQL